MSDTPIRRTNWPSSAPGEIDDPLAELERIVGRNPKPVAASAVPVAPAATPAIPSSFSAPRQPAAFSSSSSPQTSPPQGSAFSQTAKPAQSTSAFSSAHQQSSFQSTQPSGLSTPQPSAWPETAKPVAASAPAAKPVSDFLGISENDFEAAFRSFGEKPQPKAAPAATDYSAGFAASATPQRQPFTSRLEPSFSSDQAYDDDTQDYSAPKNSFENDFAASNLSQPKNTEFESRADAFDFDTRATETTDESTDIEEEVYEDAEPAYYLENKQRSGLITVIAVTGLIFVAVIGALIYSWVGSSPTGAPLVIKADTSPVKTVAKAEDNVPTNKLIYDRLGSAGEQAAGEKIVSREEQPVETLNPTEEVNAQNPRVILPNSASPDNGGMNAPRQVTTTTIRVKPDGTLESVPAPESTASTPTPAPAVTPPVVATETTPRVSQPAMKQAVANPLETSEAPPPEQDQIAAAAAAEDPSLQPATPAVAPARPQRTASVQPTQRTSAVAPTAAASTGGFVVQISSQRSDAAARSSFTAMQQKFPQVLGSYPASIKPVALGDKGTYYRVRVGPLSSRDDATALCGRLKAAGGECVVTVN